MQARPLDVYPGFDQGEGAMPDRANDPLPKAPDLSETAQAIARGRELVKEAQRLDGWRDAPYQSCLRRQPQAGAHGGGPRASPMVTPSTLML